MDEKYNESSVQWFVLSLALLVVPATSSDVKKSTSSEVISAFLPEHIWNFNLRAVGLI